MREIKFRAWDGENKLMCYDNVLVTMGSAWLEKESFDALALHLEDGRELLPLQFTGLKDKSGKEVFEGDKMSFGDETITIEFRDGCFVFVHPERDYKELANSVEHMEIIGNIYENLELLTDQGL